MFAKTENQQLNLFPSFYQAETKAQAQFEPVVKTKKVIKSLFPDQQDCVNQLKQHIAAGKRRVLLIAICGNGKTVMAGWTARDYIRQGARCLFITPFTSLISQAVRDFNALGIRSTVLRGKQKYDKRSPMIIASEATLTRRLQRYSPEHILGEGIDYIFVDEAHYTSYRKGVIRLHDHYLERGAKIIGLTGTPWRTRLDEYLGQWYDVSVEGLQPQELIKLGRALPCRIFGDTEIFDLDALDLDGDGDYRKDQITRQALANNNLQFVVDKYREFCYDAGRSMAIAFCATVEQAEKLTQTFRNSGFRADWVVGDTDDDDRADRFEAIENGSLDVLISVGCLAVGFDKRNVNAVLFVRPTNSEAFWHQAVQRAGRTAEGKYDYYILDFGSNAKRLKSPTDHLDFDIGPKIPDGFVAEEEPKTKKKKSSSPGESTPDFEEDLEEEELHFAELFLGLERKKVRFLRQQKKLCYQENFPPTLAVERFQVEFGHLPPTDWHLHAVLGKNPSKKKRLEFEEYIDRFAPHAFWAKIQKQLEFGVIEVKQKVRGK